MLQAELDTHDEKDIRRKSSFLRKRSKIVEIVAAQDLIFTLTKTGICAAFCRGEYALFQVMLRMRLVLNQVMGWL